jgi:hypothetical protein
MNALETLAARTQSAQTGKLGSTASAKQTALEILTRGASAGNPTLTHASMLSVVSTLNAVLKASVASATAQLLSLLVTQGQDVS